MKRQVAAVAAFALAMTGCSSLDEDARELRRIVNASETGPRTFEYKAIDPNEAYTMKGSIEDDFRYGMILSSDGHDLVDYVVSDDALAIRLLDPGLADRLANQLGHPDVDAALRAGRWVIDPSGAPPLFRAEVVAGTEKTGNPFRDAREGLRYVATSMTQARHVKEFTLEDIEYRPLLDPWRYPGEDGKRFDLLRAFLPKAEGQLGGDVLSVAQFRKMSVFTNGPRVDAVCSTVDIEGHEDFVALRERGPESNPYLANVLDRIRRRETAVPIEPRTVVMTFEYEDPMPVQLPQDAVTGKLDVFVSALEQAVNGGLLRPAQGQTLDDCLRRGPAGEA